ncbi:MAG: AIR synthase-related protein [Comamonadaceae bacterium]|nr:AIR synthase-related protein [Comamonadaceae bacterium]
MLAYHDRSDGGLFATLCEMAFAGRCGVDVDLDRLGYDRRDDVDGSSAGRGRRAPRRARLRRCSTRNWARCCRCARPTRGA